MKLIQRYILKGFIPPFIWCLITFAFLFIIIDLFAHLDEMLKQSVPIKTMLDYYISFIPIIFVQATPMAILIACMYALGDFNKNHEIVAIKASGLSLMKALFPLFYMGLILTIAIYIVNDRYVPSANLNTKTIKDEKLEKDKAKVASAYVNVAVSGRNNRIYYAKSFDAKNNKLYNLIILEHDKNDVLLDKITADEAAWSEVGGWKGKKCVKYNFDPKGAVKGDPIPHKEMQLPIEEKPHEFLAERMQPEFMNYKELKRYVRRLRGGSTRLIRKFKVDLYHKASFPFISLIVIVLAIPFSLKQERRSGAMMGLAFGILLGVLYYFVMAICVALGKGGFLPPLLAAWAANILFLGGGLFLLRKTPT